MNQNPSHSQTPKFETNKSQTSTHLYQNPTFAEQHPSIKASVVAQIKELVFIGLAILFALLCIATPSFVIKACADEVDIQHAQAIKHQLQFATSKEGSR